MIKSFRFSIAGLMGVVYAVSDGLLLIKVPDGDLQAVYADPVLVASGCLLTLVAMALGGALGSLVSAFPRRSLAKKRARSFAMLSVNALMACFVSPCFVFSSFRAFAIPLCVRSGITTSNCRPRGDSKRRFTSPR